MLFLTLHFTLTSFNSFLKVKLNRSHVSKQIPIHHSHVSELQLPLPLHTSHTSTQRSHVSVPYQYFTSTYFTTHMCPSELISLHTLPFILPRHTSTSLHTSNQLNLLHFTSTSHFQCVHPTRTKRTEVNEKTGRKERLKTYEWKEQKNRRQIINTLATMGPTTQVQCTSLP